MNKFILVTLLCLFTAPAFADKILSPGQIYTSRSAGEQIACTNGGSGSTSAYTFMASGRVLMSESDMRDSDHCTGTMGSSTAVMYRARELAHSNCEVDQCPRGYDCHVLAGNMQYHPRGNFCVAKLACRAVPN